MPQDSLQAAFDGTVSALPPNQTILERIRALEANAHKPFDFTRLIERIETLETSCSVALATPAALHRARNAQYQYAKLAWEKIKDNMRARSLWRRILDADLERDIDEEQIEVIRMHMGNQS